MTDTSPVTPLSDAIAFELFDDIPNDKHGQLCPIWVKRNWTKRQQGGMTWTDCDCWILRGVRHQADLVLGTPALREALASPVADTELERLRGIEAIAHRLVIAYEEFEGSHWHEEEMAYRDLKAALSTTGDTNEQLVESVLDEYRERPTGDTNEH